MGNDLAQQARYAPEIEAAVLEVGKTQTVGNDASNVAWTPDVRLPNDDAAGGPGC